MHLLSKCSERMDFWATLAQFWSSDGQQIIDWKGIKILVSDHYLNKYSQNPIQTCSVRLLGECPELIRF